MTIPTATSINAIAAEQFRTLCSLSSTLQAECGGSASQALSHVYFGSLPKLHDQTAYPRPLFIIGLTEDFRHRMIAGGSQNQLRPSGSLAFFGIRNTPAVYITGDDCDYAAAEIDHMNFFGGVLDDVASLAGSDDNLCLTEIVNRDFGEVEAKYWQELGRFYFTGGLVYWGDDLRRGM